VQHTLTDTFTILNIGDVPAQWSVIIPESSAYTLAVNPRSSNLKKGDSIVVTLELTFDQPVTFQDTLYIKVKGNT
jgi:hypothetical protein